ncbi:MAG: sensor histidine kinase [Deltaproteobacteria bacterium]|nr:MAG: sensor histidine kinase [Deltaproteobacteria bacterium]
MGHHDDHLLQATLHQEKLAELGRLSAGIAHEIRNPLSIIGYALELLCRDAALTPFQAEMAEKIEAEIERLRTLTDGLLSFSSSREGCCRLVVLNDLVEETLRLLRFELQRHAVVLTTDFNELPLVAADPNKLKQVVINLVMNAAQAMGGAGTITLRTCRAGDMVELTVADTGPGISAELIEKIFDPFFTTKPEGEGTGLGLYLCRTIVRELGGELSVDSAPGAGATFRVRLPAQ